MKEIRWPEHVACIRQKINLYNILARRLERNRIFERSMHTQKDSIKMDLNEIGFEDAD
jgi:hypothetical protein